MNTEHICCICGKPFQVGHLYDDEQLVKRQMCFNCNFWMEKIEEDKEHPERIAIIDGTHYYIGDENDKSYFRGFGGARFDIEFNDGRKITTTNLWCQGNIPEHLAHLFPNNATFDYKWEKIGNCNYLVRKEK